MAEEIRKKFNRFYSLIKNYTEGADNTRYKSWEWCHEAFVKAHKEAQVTEDQKDLLSLHLAFYLASWGMYRGSSFLLKRDYKTHKKAVEEILKPEYELLWDYKPKLDNIEEANDCLFDTRNGVYWKIKDSYGKSSEDNDLPSDTLITKILMGTFGCIPAFDRFLKEGIKQYQSQLGERNCQIEGYKLTQMLEKSSGKEATESFKALAALAAKNIDTFTLDADFYYPPMKCVDMYLWEIGYEMDMANALLNDIENDSKRIIEKKNAIINQARRIGLVSSDCFDFAEAARQIMEKN